MEENKNKTELKKTGESSLESRRGEAASARDNERGGRSCLGSMFAAAGVLISVLWLLNLGCGVIEIPDNIPIFGNLDEVFFTTLFWVSLAYFGIEIPFVRKFLEMRGFPKSGRNSPRR